MKRSTVAYKKILLCMVLSVIAGPISDFSNRRALAASAQETLQFDQSHYFFGHTVVTFNDTGFKLENLGRLGFVMVASAPHWNVSVYRKDEKIFFTENLEEFVNTGLVNSYLVSEKSKNGAKYGSMMRPMLFQNYTIRRFTSDDNTLKVFPLNGYKNARPLELIDHAAFKLPTVGGLTLNYQGKDITRDFFGAGKRNLNGIQVYLKTDKISAVKVAPDFFAIPKGYKKAPSLREVVAGADVRSESEEYLLESPSAVDHKGDKTGQSNRNPK